MEIDCLETVKYYSSRLNTLLLSFLYETHRESVRSINIKLKQVFASTANYQQDVLISLSLACQKYTMNIRLHSRRDFALNMYQDHVFDTNKLRRAPITVLFIKE